MRWKIHQMKIPNEMENTLNGMENVCNEMEKIRSEIEKNMWRDGKKKTQ